MVNEASKVTPISDTAKAIDDLREQVKSITSAVEAIKKTGITEDALLTLLSHACPLVKAPRGYGKQRLSPRTIKTVLSGMANLESFVFGQKKKV